MNPEIITTVTFPQNQLFFAVAKEFVLGMMVHHV
jgi:hypothetical protein